MSEPVHTPLPTSAQLPGRPAFIGGSDAQIIMGAVEPALIRLRREKLGEAALEDLSGKPQPSQSCERGNAKSSVSLVHAAYLEFVASLAGHPPRTIPLYADAIDLGDRADHLNKVLSALSAYMAVILDETAQNVAGRLDLPDIEAVLADLASDVTGAIQHAADGMAGRVA